MAKSSLSIYIIHCHPLVIGWVCSGALVKMVQDWNIPYPYMMTIGILLWSICMCIVCILIDKLRILLLGKSFNTASSYLSCKLVFFFNRLMDDIDRNTEKIKL